ncbi:MAG: hypothetical protein JSW07_20975 [bacterium]|nr:MAG: hypothetical protein JSW07_20975 [bacterium]
MTKTLDATFNGEVLRLDEPLELEPNIRIPITIETWHQPTKKDDKMKRKFVLSIIMFTQIRKDFYTI